MAGISPFVKPLGTAAAIIGLIQAIVWTVMALLALLIYLQAWIPMVSNQTYGQSLSLAIIAQFLISGYRNPLVYIQPLQFFIWVILYLIVSLIWIGLSSYLLYVATQQQYKLVKKTFLAWASWTIIVCICDLILASLLASDYNTVVGILNLTPTLVAGPLSYSVLAIGVVMTLAARGFVLWVVNLTMAILILKLSTEDHDKAPVGGAMVSSNNSDRFGQTTPGGQSYTNSGFIWDANKPSFTRSDSFVSAQPPSGQGQENFNRLPPITSTNERLAKIGRQGPKSPPQSVAPPKIPQSYIYPTQPRVPSPDYSPPSSPFQQTPLKPVLKPRPQNAYGFKY